MVEGSQKKNTRHVEAPPLDWLDGDVPKSAAFDDTYFSKAGGLDETRHVFLAGNDLPQRFSGRPDFVIAEFGFGTGLNLLATLESLRKMETAPQLVYVSFELYPMTRDQLRRAHAAFPALGQLSAELLELWDPVPGWSTIQLEGASLCLGLGDARQMTGEIREGSDFSPGLGTTAPVLPPIDAWFLDGFAPSRNPELWGEDLLARAFRLTAPGGTLATYTAAGWVRRNLAAAGFAIRKTKGFAGKREMVTGTKE